MKPLYPSLFMLVVSIPVVLAQRRRVPFMNCESTRSNDNLSTSLLARSRIECSLICLNDEGCLSASFCKTGDIHMCLLSSVYANGNCSGLGTDNDCTLTAIMYPCENGGTFIPENRTCLCAVGFVGDYCERRYRDCIETPRVMSESYIIEPFGSHYEFEWGCPPTTTSYTEITVFYSSNTYDYALTWQQIKKGVPKFPGFFILGTETMHELTKQGRYDVFVLLFVPGKPKGYLRYRNFRVDSEAEGYALHWDSFEPDTSIDPGSVEYLDALGGAGDASKNLNGARFGTFDNDVNGCASANNVAWWYNPLGCTTIKFESNGIQWPTNRTGTVVMEPMTFATFGMIPVYWYIEDDLVL